MISIRNVLLALITPLAIRLRDVAIGVTNNIVQPLGIRLIGYEVFLEEDDPRCGLFDFERKVTQQGDWAVWGLGFHLVIGRVMPTRPAL